MTITLKDGSTTTDRRLDRLVEFDEASRAYPVRRLLSASQLQKPRSYTWTCPIWLDQGREGACVGFSISGELAARPYMVSGINNPFAQQLYYTAQRNDPWPGGEYPGADPVYGGTSVLSGIKTAQDMGYYGGYSWAFSEEELMLAVSWKGPAVLGIVWYESMYETDSKFMIRPGGNVAGGHAILCNGFSAVDQVYRLHNSWGTSFGKGGDCFITRADMKTWLANDGEVCVPERRAYGK